MRDQRAAPVIGDGAVRDAEMTDGRAMPGLERCLRRTARPLELERMRVDNETDLSKSYMHDISYFGVKVWLKQRGSVVGGDLCCIHRSNNILSV
jgi:hypothetical protein